MAMLDNSDLQPGLRFLDLTFDTGCRNARRDDGVTIAFTRKEGALLEALTRRPSRLLSRERLLIAMAGSDAEVTDRSVDFTVNRLRRKLNDPARAPRFIRAVYGEGYIWIASRDVMETDDFLVVFTSLPATDATRSRENAVLDQIVEALRAKLPEGRTVRQCGSRRDAASYRGAPFGVEVSFHEVGGVLHVALMLHDRRTDAVLAARRLTCGDAGPGDPAGEAVEGVLAAIWRQVTLARGDIPAPATVPLEVRASIALDFLMGEQRWTETQPDYLAAALSDSSEDKLIALIGRQLQALRRVALGDIAAAEFEAHCKALERDVLEILPDVQDDPQLALVAAKLLIDADARNADLAERLAMAAFERTTAFAAAFATLGQIRFAQGAYADAMAFFDRGLALYQGGGDFQLYLLIWKCFAALALGDKATFVATRTVVFETKPMARAQVGLALFGMGAETEDDRMQVMIAAMKPQSVRKRLSITYSLLTRLLPDAAILKNFLARTVVAAIAAHGPDAVPEDLAAAMAG